ncbi:Na+-transporting NADH:ubiquinone oxidoreductase subunit NqrC [Mesotoga sp. SC_3PWM13N19]|jgi:Na+-transporting NADH:ubiquinone oxidoreductase subunit C|uniref:FMN-binding protein n=1 Tax=unclassified Mesotoga TaxID=1184398 RepID=UPI000DC03E47|nr:MULTISPECIES: FMN-binding protein [unclassified Mesotoga]MDD3460262.1 FMN-binding protein [Mesotoga sp.]RAM61024.1 Na+-transporting NADH:ubiquinone oxidoreductase subunit NqrC [Mesotoga sp. SC_3PWM13N19]HNS35623.1 FMN-binding protein [Mesotoga sp.]
MSEKLYSVVFTFILTTVFVICLAGINAIASGTIERNEQLEFRRSLIYVFNIVEDARSLTGEEVQKLYLDRIQEIDGEQTVYIADNEGKREIAFTVQSAGLWGTITALVAVDESGSRIVGIDFVNHSETPGLGGRIDETAFKEQFRGERISSSSSARIAVVSGQDTGSKDDSKVDAITGATRTSESIQTLLNKAINDVFPAVLEAVN